MGIIFWQVKKLRIQTLKVGSLALAQVEFKIGERLYGDADIDAFYSIEQTSDKGFILSGETYNNGLGDILHVKTDPNGNVLSE